MNLEQAHEVAASMLAEHGLAHWHVKFNNAKRIFGLCNHAQSTIYLSSVLVQLNDETRVRQTVLHEIAHALVGPGHGHDRVWKRKAREIGDDGERCYNGVNTVTPKAKWKLVCPKCGDSGGKRHRKTLAQLACGGCCRKHNRGRWHEDYVLAWKRA